MYRMSLVTDEFSLTGEVYEREDKAGFEYRLSYILCSDMKTLLPLSVENPFFRWEGTKEYDSKDKEWSQKEAEKQLRQRFSFPDQTIRRFFS